MAAVPTKQLLRQLINELPDDCTVEDAQYRLHVLSAVARGRADIEAGRIISQEQVEAELERRWGKGREP